MNFRDRIDIELNTWVPVPGYQCEVTKYGDVRSFTGNILSQYLDKDGYQRVKVKKVDKWKTEGVHVLITLTFHGEKPSIHHEVNHTDLDKSNNYYRNLEWVTPSGNRQHALKNGVKMGFSVTPRDNKGTNNGNAKLDPRKAKLIKKLYKTGKYTYKDLGAKFKVHPNTILYVAKHNFWLKAN